MTKQMYSVAGGGPGNEELARRLQTGDVLAAAQLVSQNEGYLTVLARNCCEPFSQHSLEEDLKQEGAMALLSAAGRFDFDAGTKLLTFATPIVQTAMLDCAAKSFSALPLPPSRYYQLRQIAFCALPGFVDSKNEEKTERNAGYLVVSHSGGGMLRQGTRKGIRRTPANRGMRAHWVVKGLDISEDVCHGMCP